MARTTFAVGASAALPPRARHMAASLALVFLVLRPLPANADIAPKWSVAELTAFADIIVTGRVADVRTGWDSGTIYTYVTVDVENALKGSVPDRQIVVKQLGGRADDLALLIGGQATFTTGEHVLAFLEMRPRDFTLSTTGLWQGKWTIRDTATSGQAVASRSVPGASTRAPFAAAVETLPLSALLAEVRQVTAAASTAQRATTAGIVFHPRDAESTVRVVPVDATSVFTPAWTREARNQTLIGLEFQRSGQLGLVDGGFAELLSAAQTIAASSNVATTERRPTNSPCFTTFGDTHSLVFSFGNACDEMSTEGGTIALGGVWVDASGRRSDQFMQILQGGVIVNAGAAALARLTSPACFASIVRHELGHAFGIGDGSGSMGAVMPILQCNGAGVTPVASNPAAGAGGSASSAVNSAGVSLTGAATGEATLSAAATPAYQRVSIGSGGTQANGASGNPALSGNGQCVAFESTATNLVSGDTNGVTDIFVFDRRTGLTTRESLTASGAQATGASSTAAISDDCRFVAFQSDATNLVSGVSGTQIYVRDRTLATTILVSVSSTGVTGNGSSGQTQQPAISGDGRFVSFSSDATNLVPGDTNGCADIFTHDLTGPGTTRDNVSSTGAQAICVTASSTSRYPALSRDGRYVAFDSDARNLVANTPSAPDYYSFAFVHDRATGVTTLESRNGSLFFTVPSISADGRYVGFREVSGCLTLLLRDRVTGQYMDLTGCHGPVAGPYDSLRISADAQYFSYHHLSFRGVDAGERIVLGNWVAGGGASAPIGYSPTAVAANTFAFVSKSVTLVDNDTNGVADVFVGDVAQIIPSAPTSLTFTLVDTTLMLTWSAPTAGPPPTSYYILAGSAFGGTDLAFLNTNSAARTYSMTVSAAGPYYMRVVAKTDIGSSAPSNEIVVTPATVTQTPCSPSGLTGYVDLRSSVSLYWTRPADLCGGAVGHYIIDAGSAPGAANLANVSTQGNVTYFYADDVPNGTYYVRVRAANSFGASPPSNEVVVTVPEPCPALAAPTSLTSAVTGTTVTLTWVSHVGLLASFLLEAGSSSGLANLASFDTGPFSSPTLTVPGVGTGTYFVRVRSKLDRCVSGPSNETIVTVR